MKRIAILGSTGSIGTQALEVVEEHSDKFEIEVLTAFSNADLLIEQAKKYQPNVVVIANEAKYSEVSAALSAEPVKVYAGADALAQIVEMDTIDMVLTAMVGYAGLLPTIKAIESKKTIALANKETLVVAGKLISRLSAEHKVPIIPVDSEHSAIFQCLAGEFNNEIEKIYLTASGGPFRDKSIEFIRNATKTEALNHPNWNMGAKITIDSASMMNKGLEMIEAKWLFNLSPKQIDVIVHPQSIIHSIAQFEDGSMKAQMGLPDMKLPIQYALSYPHRISSCSPRFDFAKYPELTFEKPDLERFPCLALAIEALEKCGNVPCVMNAANEVAVDAFLNAKISFGDIPVIIGKTMHNIEYNDSYTYKDFVESDTEARSIAKSFIGSL